MINILYLTLLKTINQTTSTLFLTLTVLLLTNCKKKDTEKPIVFPVTFYAEKLQVTSIIRMFTKDGEIKDQQKIERFVKNVIYFNLEQEQNDIGSEAVTFFSKEKAYFSGNEASIFDVTQSGQQFLFTSEMKYILAPSNQNDFTKHIFKHRNVKTDGGFASSEVREVRVAYGNYQQIQFPILAYHTFSGNLNTSFKLGGTTFNEFNEGVMAYMKTGDTIAIKSYKVICVAK
jgi:hypothetical protein